MVMTNKEIAVDFIKTCALIDPKQAFEKYINTNFKHHNQYFKGDASALMNAMIEADQTHPNIAFNIKQVFESNDQVAIFSQVVKKEMEIAVVHIMRFENGKISELWDLGQMIDKDSPNENGIF